MSQAMPYLFCPRRWLSRHDVCALNHTCTLFVVRASSLGRISVATQSFDGCNSVRTLRMDTTAAVGTHVIISRHFYRELAYSEVNGVEYMRDSHSPWPRIPAEFHCLDSGAKRWLLILRVSLRIPQRGANANGALEQGNSAPTPILMETDRQCRYNPVDVAQRQVLRQRRDREFLRLSQRRNLLPRRVSQDLCADHDVARVHPLVHRRTLWGHCRTLWGHCPKSPGRSEETYFSRK